MLVYVIDEARRLSLGGRGGGGRSELRFEVRDVPADALTDDDASPAAAMAGLRKPPVDIGETGGTDAAANGSGDGVAMRLWSPNGLEESGAARLWSPNGLVEDAAAAAVAAAAVVAAPVPVPRVVGGCDELLLATLPAAYPAAPAPAGTFAAIPAPVSRITGGCGGLPMPAAVVAAIAAAPAPAPALAPPPKSRVNGASIR